MAVAPRSRILALPAETQPNSYEGFAIVTRYHFSGFPAFLDAAAAEIGRPEAAGPARRNATLAAVSTLCAQAAEAERHHVAGILAKAQEIGDQLEVAHRASQLMLSALRAGCGSSDVPFPSQHQRPAPVPSQTRGATRKHG